MCYYIRSIKVNEIFHLANFTIPVGNSASPHLIITGRNGSGKTILLNAVVEFFERVKSDTSLCFLQYKDNLNNLRDVLKQAMTLNQQLQVKRSIADLEGVQKEVFG